ncbi:hypothetical protein FGK63_09325 [Ruegeria sediminis]|uniref:Surface antigen domain-containing protein n=1 Tax=Ruegeria sediminis TaxID=2583820 RepID=A0ABY2WXR6_9RHOB|nr:hypothetical protein [Ruegeria sediminis]TMV07659.1 hypothetical protein FGK63_09325 [Ruegeria sediminis]
MKAWVCTVLVTAALFFSGSEGQAKPLSRMVAELGLSPADFEMQNAAAASLFAKGRPLVGQEASWSNPDTGSKGTVRVREMQEDCAHLQHFVVSGKTGQTREIRTRRCLDAGGNWILTP